MNEQLTFWQVVLLVLGLRIIEAILRGLWAWLMDTSDDGNHR